MGKGKNASWNNQSVICGDCKKIFKTQRGLDDHVSHVHSRRPTEPPTCCECGLIAKITSGDKIYPNLPHLFSKPYWRCDCGAYVGCHDGTVRPLGRPAGYATRRARNIAHDTFDPIWREVARRQSPATPA